MKNEVWTKLFGYEVNREMKEIVLNEITATGDPIEKVIARYTLPTMAILGPDGKFDDMPSGRRLTPEEWKKANPLGDYGRIVVIRT
jgi:hypothetical protein